jgi:hypothetical protein
VKAAPVNPVEAVIVVPLMVDPWNVPPLNAAPVNPVEAVIVVPLTVDPWNVPPVKAEPEKVPRKRPDTLPVTIIFVVVRVFAIYAFPFA